MSSEQNRFRMFGRIDFRLAFVAVFLGFMTVWDILEGELFPDALFFAVMTVLMLVFAFVGLGSDEGFELGENNG